MKKGKPLLSKKYRSQANARRTSSDRNIDKLYQTALTYKQLGLHYQSENTLKTILSIEPFHVKTLLLLADLDYFQGRHQQAIARLVSLGEQAVVENPTFLSIADQLMTWGSFSEAATCLRRALITSPNHPALHFKLAKTCYHLGDRLSAISHYRRTGELTPHLPDAFYAAASTCQEIGDRTGAISNSRLALQADPGFAEAYLFLAKNIREPQELKELQKELIKRLTAVELPEKQRMLMQYSLGLILDRIGETGPAFMHLNDANQQRRASYNFDMSSVKNYFQEITNIFTPDLIKARARAGIISNRPIFIVGLPRSGSSLIEQILASHSQIHGAGELNFLGELIAGFHPEPNYKKFPSDFPKLSDQGIHEFGQCYLDKIDKLDTGNTRFIVDKMLFNFIYLGLLKIILPGARVIHCHRHPMDTCFSCFKNYFSANGSHFVNNLEEIGHYYVLYDRLMSHWRNLIPDFFIDIKYEEMVADQVSQTHRLLDFIGLDWEDACLNFHKSRTIVKTISASQVRQPIYNSSVNHWQQYARQLDPLMAILGSAGLLD
jgi:tetratricopeptide (TPR) repeat protein